jgi:hypothetical protein
MNNKRDPHEFCEKELDSLRSIVDDLRMTIDTVLGHQLEWRSRHALNRALQRSIQTEISYWKDTEPIASRPVSDQELEPANRPVSLYALPKAKQ